MQILCKPDCVPATKECRPTLRDSTGAVMPISLARVAVLLAALGGVASAGFDDPIHAKGFWFKLDYNWDGNVTEGFSRGYATLTILDLRGAKTLVQAKDQQVTWFKKRGYKAVTSSSTKVGGRPAWIVSAAKMAYHERWGADQDDPTGPLYRQSAGQEPMAYFAIIFMTKKGATGYFFEATEDAPHVEIIQPIMQSTHID